MGLSNAFSYQIECLLDMSGSSVPCTVSLTAANEEEAIAAFRTWCAEHPDGYNDLPYYHRPYLIQERLLAKAEDFE